MSANTITLARPLLTFGVITLFGVHPILDRVLIVTIVLIFVLDALDGYIARKRNETSETGAVLDTLADRVIENTFWIYFTAMGLIPVWMPIAVMARGVITDALQHQHGYPQNGWTHALTRSRASRGLYGAAKMFAFMSLASGIGFKEPSLETLGLILAAFAVGFCLLRGLPFFYYGTHHVHQAPKKDFP